MIRYNLLAPPQAHMMVRHSSLTGDARTIVQRYVSVGLGLGLGLALGVGKGSYADESAHRQPRAQRHPFGVALRDETKEHARVRIGF